MVASSEAINFPKQRNPSENKPDNILGMPRRHFVSRLRQWGIKPAHAPTIMRQIHKRGVLSPKEMFGINATSRARLTTHLATSLPKLCACKISTDGTQKWRLHFSDGVSAESVIIPGARRITLCVSSQAGCALNCAFCATAKSGFVRNLSSAEIISQLWLANRALAPQAKTICNVVFMGMGEPLLNFSAVASAIEIMRDDHAYGLSRRRVVVSTAGHIAGMRKIARYTDASLTVSLHAPDDKLRDYLVPLNKRYPIEKLLDACYDYLNHRPASEKIILAYTMLKNVNDGIDCVKRLAGLIKELPAKVNLIPFNSFPGSSFECATSDAISAFRDVLMEHDIFTVVRRPRGDAISAASGIL